MHRSISLALLAVGLLVATGSAAILYVDSDAPPGGDGQSWSTAYRFLQDALSATDPNVTEIRVAQGLYLPDRTAADPNGTGERNAAFFMRSELAIVGGYAGLGEPEPGLRDPNSYISILSGDLAGNDGPDFANNQENSYHVVLACLVDGSAVLDGFTITAGNADANSLPDNAGGGLRCDVLDPSTAGHPTVSHCVFRANHGRYSGGVDAAARAAGLISHPTFSACRFEGNRAAIGGGAISLWGSQASMTGCSFAGNVSLQNGGALRVGSENSSGSGPILEQCTFSGNQATRSGGAVYCESNGIPLRMYDCELEGNSAGYDGGAAFYLLRPLSAWNCVFIGNTAGRRGGAVVVGSGSSFSDCLFADNTAVTGVGGLFISAGSLRNCTIVNNVAAGSPGGVAISGNLSNCILRGNVPNQIDPNSAPTVGFADIQGGWPGTGNIDADPLFVDPDGPDNDPNTWADNDYHLSPLSPCINAGDPNLVAQPGETDLDGEPRVLFGVVDMGSDEATVFADCNSNGVPDGRDILLEMSPDANGNNIPDECEGLPFCRGDCNCDGQVGFTDIDLFVAAIPNNLVSWRNKFQLYHGHQPPAGCWENCDVNGAGTHAGFDDIDPFVALIPSACPR